MQSWAPPPSAPCWKSSSASFRLGCSASCSRPSSQGPSSFSLGQVWCRVVASRTGEAGRATATRAQRRASLRSAQRFKHRMRCHGDRASSLVWACPASSPSSWSKSLAAQRCDQHPSSLASSFPPSSSASRSSIPAVRRLMLLPASPSSGRRRFPCACMALRCCPCWQSTAVSCQRPLATLQPPRK